MEQLIVGLIILAAAAVVLHKALQRFRRAPASQPVKSETCSGCSGCEGGSTPVCLSSQRLGEGSLNTHLRRDR